MNTSRVLTWCKYCNSPNSYFEQKRMFFFTKIAQKRYHIRRRYLCQMRNKSFIYAITFILYNDTIISCYFVIISISNEIVTRGQQMKMTKFNISAPNRNKKMWMIVMPFGCMVLSSRSRFFCHNLSVDEYTKRRTSLHILLVLPACTLHITHT